MIQEAGLESLKKSYFQEEKKEFLKEQRLERLEANISSQFQKNHVVQPSHAMIPSIDFPEVRNSILEHFDNQDIGFKDNYSIYDNSRRVETKGLLPSQILEERKDVPNLRDLEAKVNKMTQKITWDTSDIEKLLDQKRPTVKNDPLLNIF